MWKKCFFKQNFTLKLFIAFKMTYEDTRFYRAVGFVPI